MKFAQDARKAGELASSSPRPPATGTTSKTHVNTLGQQCAGCHGAYRERGEDGSFFIKPGSRRPLTDTGEA